MTFDTLPATADGDVRFVGTSTSDRDDRSLLVSIVIPGYNEQENIARLESEVRRVTDGLPYQFEFIFVDNSSTDSTGERVKEICRRDHRWKYIRFSRNFFIDSSMSAGYRHASGDAIILLYSDLQEPPQLIPQMLEHWRKGYDVVYAVQQKRVGEPLHRVFLVRIAYRLVRWFSESEIPVDCGDFRLISRNVRDHLEQCGEYHRFTRGLISWLGFSQIGIPYQRQPRLAGDSKAPLAVCLAYFVHAITTFSLKPLRMVFALGLAMIATSLVGLLVVALGWTTLGTCAPLCLIAALVVCCAGVNSLGLGVIGEYVGRTYTEIQQRPRYIIEETENIDVIIPAGGVYQPARVAVPGNLSHV